MHVWKNYYHLYRHYPNHIGSRGNYAYIFEHILNSFPAHCTSKKTIKVNNKYIIFIYLFTKNTLFAVANSELPILSALLPSGPVPAIFTQKHPQ